MLRKKICTMLAAVMVATMVLGNNVQVVSATELNANSQVEIGTVKSVVDGEYEVNNSVYKIGTEEESRARSFIEEMTNITVNDGKVMMTVKYKGIGLTSITNTTVKVDGVVMNSVVNEDKSITFEVPSIDSKVELEMTIVVPGVFTEVQSVDLVNDISSIPTVDDSENGETPEVPGNNESSGSEDSNNNGDTSGEEVGDVLANGTYKIANKTLKVGTDNNSGIRGYIDENSIITVKDGKITVTMKYNEAGLETVQSTNSITVDGENVELTKNDDGSISFDIKSIDLLYTRINVNLTYHDENLPEFIFPGKIHTVDVELLHEGDLTEYTEEGSSDDSVSNEEEETPSTPDNNGGNTGNTENEDSNNGVTEEQASKVYTGKNEVTHDNETGLSMARKVLEETLKVEEVNGVNYVTLTFTPMGSTMMKDYVIYVNGNKVDTTKTLNGEIVSLRFAVGSLDDSIEVSGYVTMMGSNVDFGVKVLKDTLILVTDNTTNNGTTGGTTTGDSSNNNSTSNETTENTESTTEEQQVIKGKLYSIQNNVTHESETGRTMARKYLNATSKVEEIDGKYYVTFTFTGAEFMQNHEIYVNGKKVSITKTTNGDSTNIRFAVSSLSDTIKVKTYVVPMSKEVEFGVELLQDTLTFIKEYTVETLPQTGAAASSAAVAGLGLLLTSAGAVLAKKRK